MGCLIAGAAGYEDLSLRENLRAQALLLPDPGSADLRALCALVGLDEGSRRRTLRQCSTGERQRYGLAAALLGDPELLLLDDLQDIAGKMALERELTGILRSLAESGRTVIITSSREPERMIHLDRDLKALLNDAVIVDLN